MAMLIKDRIKELRRISASKLRPNPNNWRQHPQNQQNAIRGLLAEIGFVGALLARELDDGTYELIDGHLRAEVTSDTEVPVLVLDVTADEAKLILATYDTITGMAEPDQQALDRLLQEVQPQCDALQSMLDDLSREAGLSPPNFEPVSIDDQGKLDTKSPITCPHCGESFVPKP